MAVVRELESKGDVMLGRAIFVVTGLLLLLSLLIADGVTDEARGRWLALGGLLAISLLVQGFLLERRARRGTRP